MELQPEWTISIRVSVSEFDTVFTTVSGGFAYVWLLTNVQGLCVNDNCNVMTAVFSRYLLILNCRYGVQLE
jgi:hypothetical protein